MKVRSLRYVNELGNGPGNPLSLDEDKINSIGFGLTVGYQWVSSRGFIVEVFVGAGGMTPALTHYQHTMRYGNKTSDIAYDY